MSKISGLSCAECRALLGDLVRLTDAGLTSWSFCSWTCAETYVMREGERIDQRLIDDRNAARKGRGRSAGQREKLDG